MKFLGFNLAPLLLAPTFVLGTLALGEQPTSAQERQQLTALRRITQEEAVGAGTTPPTIALVPGYGLNISFIPTGETIEKIWLDNPQYATLDVDGCLEDLRATRKCERPGAQIVHLRRIQDLRFPGLYSTRSTLLTVVTNAGVRRNVYTFRVIKGSGMPSYNTIEIVPTPGYSNPNNIELTNIESAISYSTIVTGKQAAMAQGLLQSGSRLWTRIDNFLLRLQSGTPVREAIALSGLSSEVVWRLHNLGLGIDAPNRPRTTSVPVRLPPPNQIPAPQVTPVAQPQLPVYQTSPTQPVPAYQQPVYQPIPVIPPTVPVPSVPTYPTVPISTYPYPSYPVYPSGYPTYSPYQRF